MVSPLQTEEFVRLLGKHQQRVYAFILTLEPRWNDADEVLQETNTVLWRKFAQFQPNSDFVRWACQVAYFEVLKHRKRRKQDHLMFTESLVEIISGEAIGMSDQLDEQRQLLEDCRQKLTERERDLLDRRYQLGATVQSVSQELGRSVDAVYKALQRIHASLLACVRRSKSAEDQP